MKTYVSAAPLSDDLKSILDDQQSRGKLIDMLLRRGSRRQTPGEEKSQFQVGKLKIVVSSGSPITTTDAASDKDQDKDQ